MAVSFYWTYEGQSGRRSISLDEFERSPASGNDIKIKTVPIGRLPNAQITGEGDTVLMFASKVVSRQHAILIISHPEQKVFLQDSGSSSGTFLNGVRISPHGRESPKIQLHHGDWIKLGEDYETPDKALHRSIAMRVALGSFWRSDISADAQSTNESSYGEIALDPALRASIDEEFRAIMESLTGGQPSPIERLRELMSRPQLHSRHSLRVQRTSTPPTGHLSSRNESQPESDDDNKAAQAPRQTGDGEIEAVPYVTAGETIAP
ncbi:uncharacterized protein BJ171DRAFT_597913 [Polychytrium aggregatum]|uniref:uncharacterized protein n=1 Tax=Polychytrium aggregatum TaxID=110093 RepID=UPI0022FE2BA6|nr:uncharacterized protein BJ171DRAFT_597913 [Polychytrium aggregatum]KAI9206250.1 hypothetical protein BJ171DRAFT_597913 [Polychytrium aggregatum]